MLIILPIDCMPIRKLLNSPTVKTLCKRMLKKYKNDIRCIPKAEYIYVF